MKKTLHRRTVLVLLLLLTGFMSHAQMHRPQRLPLYDTKRYHFGFTLGACQMNFIVRPVDDLIGLDSVFTVLPTPQEGFYVSIVSDMKLGEHLNARFIPGLIFGDRDVHYTIRDNNYNVYTYVKNVESTFLEFPVYLKYKSNRINDNNYRAYVFGGLKYTLDLASESKKPANDIDVLLKIKRDDLAIDLGTGFDFYLDYFKLGVELKMSYGIRNLLVEENNVFTQSVKTLNSKIFFIGFTFE